MTDESFFKDFLVYEYPSPSTNEGLGLPLKLEQLTIFIKLLEKLLNEITLLIFFGIMFQAGQVFGVAVDGGDRIKGGSVTETGTKKALVSFIC
jgi:hypothetical protein